MGNDQTGKRRVTVLRFLFRYLNLFRISKFEFRICPLCFFVFFVSTAFAQSLPSQVLFRAGEGNYNNYRIPALAVTTKGTVLAFCEGRQAPAGPGNDTGEINVIVRRSTDGGKTFGAPAVVWKDGSDTCGNPTAVVDAMTGTIFLLMTHNRGQDHEREITAGTAGDRTVWITSSTTDGETWTTPIEITAAVKRPKWAWYATGPGIGIQLTRGTYRGRLIVPCDHVDRGGGKGHGNAHVIYSDDHGATWKIGGEPPIAAFNESQAVELEDGSVMLNMRPYVAGKRADVPRVRGVAISRDGGETFSMQPAEELVDPICQGSILRYSFAEAGEKRGRGGKEKLLFSNPPSKDSRVGMCVRVSYDDGKTWPVSRRIFEGRSGYSCLSKLADGTMGLLYEAGDAKNYERIEFVRFGMETLEAGK
jgi:sialidase-1